MLMERRPDLHVPAAAWEGFLLDAFAENRPLRPARPRDPLGRRVRPRASRPGEVRARPRGRSQPPDPRRRPAVPGPRPAVRPVPRPLLYRRLQAGPLLRPLRLLQPQATSSRTRKGVATVGEKADGDVTFNSVFKKKVTHTTGPRILDGQPVAEPAGGQGAGILGRPGRQGPRRASLQPPGPARDRRWHPDKAPEFSRNLANRLWAVMMGRGLVHPLDLHTPTTRRRTPSCSTCSPASSWRWGSTCKAFLRELALTRSLRAVERAAAGAVDRGGRARDVRRRGPEAACAPSNWRGA